MPVSTDASFGAIPYITATINSVTVNLPITQVDDVNNALEFPDGRIVLLTLLCEGQQATVLQLPAQPTSAEEAREQERVTFVG